MTLMTSNEVAQYLKLSPSYLRRLVMLNKIPYIKFDRAVRFEKKDVDDFLMSRRVDKR